MIDIELEELSRDTPWGSVLQAYLAKEQAVNAHARAVASESGMEINTRDWIPRLAEVKGVEREDLSKIHGMLIALGYLEFQLFGREKGVCYRVSPLGKQTLEQEVSAEADHPLLSWDQSEAA